MVSRCYFGQATGNPMPPPRLLYATGVAISKQVLGRIASAKSHRWCTVLGDEYVGVTWDHRVGVSPSAMPTTDAFDVRERSSQLYLWHFDAVWFWRLLLPCHDNGGRTGRRNSTFVHPGREPSRHELHPASQSASKTRRPSGNHWEIFQGALKVYEYQTLLTFNIIIHTQVNVSLLIVVRASVYVVHFSVTLYYFCALILFQ